MVMRGLGMIEESQQGKSLELSALYLDGATSGPSLEYFLVSRSSEPSSDEVTHGYCSLGLLYHPQFPSPLKRVL